MSTLSNYDEVLKLYYLDGIRDQLNNDTILASQIDTNEKDISGKDAKIECHITRNSGIGARADGGSLPTAGYQGFKQATVPMKYVYGRCNFTGPTIAATRDDKGAYARVIDTEIRGVVTDIQKEVNRMLWGTGYGVLGRWRTGSASAHTVQKAYRANTGGGDGFGSTFGAKYMTEGRTVSVVVPGSASSSKFTVSTVDGDSLTSTISTGTTYDTVTFSANPTVAEAAGTYYCRPASVASVTASSAAGAARLEMMGLRGIVTNTDLDEATLFSVRGDGSTANYGLSVNDPLQGLDVSTYPIWKSVVKTHGSGRYAGQRALTFKLMQEVFDEVEENAGVGAGPNLILTSRAIRREYLELCRADRRSVNTMQLDGGWTALDYNGVHLVVDNDAIDGEIYFLTTSDLQLYRMSDYDWMQKDGAILSRVSGYDQYEAVLFRYAELGCTRRNTQGVLCDLVYS